MRCESAATAIAVCDCFYFLEQYNQNSITPFFRPRGLLNVYTTQKRSLSRNACHTVNRSKTLGQIEGRSRNLF